MTNLPFLSINSVSCQNNNISETAVAPLKHSSRLATASSQMSSPFCLPPQEHQSFTSKLFLRSKPLRALDCGQDRFKRRYWVLSQLGAVSTFSPNLSRFCGECLSIKRKLLKVESTAWCRFNRFHFLPRFTWRRLRAEISRKMKPT